MPSVWHKLRLLSLFLGAGALYILFNGHADLMDWDEVNFAECAREMYVTGDYLTVRIGYAPFWEKPPLFFWLQALSFHLWGVNAFAARFPNALVGLLTLVCLFFLGKRYYNKTFGAIWAFFHGFSVLPLFYFKSGLIDPLFNLFIFLASAGWLMYLREGKKGYVVASGISLGASVLTKGPVGALLAVLSVGIFHVLAKRRMPWGMFFLWGLIGLGVASSWYVALILKEGSDIFMEFIRYQVRLFSTADAGHGGPWYYHFVVLLLGCFPASFFALGAMRLRLTRNPLALLMVAQFFWTLLIFSVVKTKILHYSSFAYYAISFAASWAVLFRWRTILPYVAAGVGIWGIGVGSLIFTLPLWAMKKNLWIKYIQNPFAQAALQHTSLSWSYWEGWWGIVVIWITTTAFWAVRRRTVLYRLLGLLGIVWLGVMHTFIPKIIAYTQGPAVEFCKRWAGQEVYLHSIGYKTYVPYFYGQLRPWQTHGGRALSPEAFENYLLSGEIDRPAVFISRIDRYQAYLKHFPQLQVLGSVGGYIFLFRWQGGQVPLLGLELAPSAAQPQTPAQPVTP
ncbi:MAG: ArnT family glycosyltransferase [Bacteroidia bacterium]